MQQQPAGFVANREEAAERVREALGGRYSFRDGGALLEEALTHSLSPPPNSKAGDGDGKRRRRRRRRPASHRRLEFIGDSALGLAFSTLFYREYPGLGPGELTALRSANTSNEKLARAAVRHDLYPLLRRHNCDPLDRDVIDFTKSLRRNTPYSGGLIKAPKVLADIVEAIAGAVYVDSEFDLKKLQEVAKLLCDPIITKETLYKNPVSMLNEFSQKHNKDFKYNVSGRKLKVANVILDGKLVGIGSAKQIKAARRNAARDALNTLMVDQKEQVSTTGSGIAGADLDSKSDHELLQKANVILDGELVGIGSAKQIKAARRNAAQDALNTLMVDQKDQVSTTGPGIAGADLDSKSDHAKQIKAARRNAAQDALNTLMVDQKEQVSTTGLGIAGADLDSKSDHAKQIKAARRNAAQDALNTLMVDQKEQVSTTGPGIAGADLDSKSDHELLQKVVVFFYIAIICFCVMFVASQPMY